MREDVHLHDQPHGEGGEGVSPTLGSRDHEEFELRIAIQAPEDVGRGNERLAYASKRFDGDLVRTVLKEVGDVILDGRRVWQTDMLPHDIEELPEVLFKWINWVDVQSRRHQM